MSNDPCAGWMLAVLGMVAIAAWSFVIGWTCGERRIQRRARHVGPWPPPPDPWPPPPPETEEYRKARAWMLEFSTAWKLRNQGVITPAELELVRRRIRSKYGLPADNSETPR